MLALRSPTSITDAVRSASPAAVVSREIEVAVMSSPFVPKNARSSAVARFLAAGTLNPSFATSCLTRAYSSVVKRFTLAFTDLPSLRSTMALSVVLVPEVFLPETSLLKNPLTSTSANWLGRAIFSTLNAPLSPATLPVNLVFVFSRRLSIP